MTMFRGNRINFSQIIDFYPCICPLSFELLHNLFDLGSGEFQADRE